MDRQIVFPGAIPLETDILNTNRNAMVGIAALAAAIMGSSTIVRGMAVAPTSPASLQVKVAPGEIYSLQNLDNAAYSSLAADTTHQIVKQGIQLSSVLLTCAAPTSAGQSVNYLVQAAFTEVDQNATVLSYYNSSSPSTPYTGPANSGAAQPTTRADGVTLSAKAGTPATTGSQTTPAPDAGFVGLYVITIAYGATTIVSGNIAPLAGAPIIMAGLLADIQAGAYNYATAAGTSALVAALSPPPAALVAGMEIVIKPASANSDGATLNLNGFGAKSITYAGNAVVAGMMSPGQIYTLVYDGTNWQLQNPNLSAIFSYADKVSAGSDTVTVPAWATHAEVQIIGGGGGGGGAGSSFSGGGGGAGGYSFGIVSVTPGATLTRIVGAGGAGGSAGVGSAGGASSLTGVGSVNGGSGGQSSTPSSAGGNGGAVPTNGGMRNFAGGTGQDGSTSSAATVGGIGAAGPFGGSGRSGSGVGVNGTAAGAGGGGSYGSGNGGIGAAGAVLIRWLP